MGRDVRYEEFRRCGPVAGGSVTGVLPDSAAALVPGVAS
jgi:hypothetical protein